MASILAPVAEYAYKDGALDFYGAVELDASTGEVVWSFDSVAAGFPVARLEETQRGVKHRGFRPCSVERLDDGQTLVSGFRAVVWVDETGAVTRVEDHEQFNGVHEAQVTARGTYLVTVTGMDMLVEFDTDWNVVWTWRMWEHVPEGTRPPEYYPPMFLDADVREMAFHPDARYHLNYATYVDEETILASALNYGVFYLDRTTGTVQSAMTDLDETHNPVELPDGGVVVCESGRDRIVETDMSEVTGVLLDDDLSFVKDADPVPEADGADTWLIADTNNDRVFLWDRARRETVREFDLGDGAKPYEADYLTGDDSLA